jgi:flagellar assembly protein FliH
MSSSSSERRTRIVRGESVAIAARTDVVSSPSARALVVDPALVESARADGYREGYDAGFQQGMDDATATAHETLGARAEALTRAAAKLAEAAVALGVRETEALVTAEDRIVRAALRLAEVMIGVELEHCEARGRHAIARALELSPATGTARARLHPDDAATVGDLGGFGRAVEIVPDASLRPGDAVVEIDDCRVDARIESALERVRKLLDGEDPS